jgi:VWFA-related protein
VIDSPARRFVILAIVALALPLSAQQPFDSARGQAASLAQDRPTFRSSVRLVNVTVIAHDASGRPIKDLAVSDFRVFEDGQEQKIEVFAIENGSITASAAPPAPARPPEPSRIFTNRAPQRSAGGISVILFDRLNSSWADQKLARDQILRILAKASAEERIALYVLESDAITVLHDFTSDISRLTAALNKHLGAASIELARSEDRPDDFAATGMAAFDADTAAWLARTQLMVSEHYLRRRAELTTNALESIANHLAGTPGRKSLVWVSGAFPLVIPGDHGPQIMNREVNRATRAINSADVAVYPVDIRGLMPAINPTTATATVVRGGPPPPVFTTMATTHPNQDTMRQIAEATGGRVYVNTNDIGGSVRKAIDDSRVSYVLGYRSPQTDDNQRFRKIAVRVSRPGIELRYRRGYLPSPPVVRNSKARLEALTRVLQSPIEASSVPLAAELSRAKNDGTVTVRIDPESLTWTPAKGVSEAVIDVVIAQSLPDGTYFTIKETSINLNADAERYKQMVEDGLTLSSNFTVAQNAYRLHVVVSDVASQSVGSLIIPIRQ